MLKIHRIITGAMETNTYIIYKNQKCFIVDPAGTGEDIIDFIQQNQLKPINIINTHAHIDHIEANDVIKEYFNISVKAHFNAKDIMPNPEKNLSVFVGKSISIDSPEEYINDGDIMKFENERFYIMHTPGHSIDSISLIHENFIVCGDLLFIDSVGRTDLWGGNTEELYNSINKLLKNKNDNIYIYSGHGEYAQLEHILSTNPFL